MKKFLILALLLSMPTLAYTMPGMGDKGQGAKGPTAEEKFATMDSNKDKQVDMAEFKAAYPQMNDTVFGIIDSDKNSFITPKEWMDFQAKHMQGMKEDEAKKTTPQNKNLMIMPPKTKE